MDWTSNSEVRCAIVLAGGEGKRLQPLVHKLLGDTLPKQYVNFIGSRSMLEHSFHRAEMLIPREQIFTVVSRDHLKYPRVQQQLAGRPSGTVVLQPENKDTAPGVLLPLMAVYKKYPKSTVVISPSDHFVLEERLFMRHVKLAFSVVEQNPSQLVLLGIQPTQPETEFGYILPDGRHSASSLEFPCRIRRFVEKPEKQIAEDLIRKGGLWNTMVIVSKTKTLMGFIRKAIPDLYHAFEGIYGALGTPDEGRVMEAVYKELRPANFSNQLLEILPLKFPSFLSVLPVRGVFWSDMGLPRYVETAHKKIADRVEAGSTGISADLFSQFSARSLSWKTA